MARSQLRAGRRGVARSAGHGFRLELLDSASESNTLRAVLAFGIELAVGLLALAFVQAACARAMAEADAERPVATRVAYLAVLPRLGTLAAALASLSAAVVLLALSGFGILVAIWLMGRCSLVAQTVEIEGCSAWQALRRSSELVRGRWWRSATMLLAVVGAVLLTGPLVGVGLLLLTRAPFGLVNVVSSLVYALTVPFVAIATCLGQAPPLDRSGRACATPWQEAT